MNSNENVSIRQKNNQIELSFDKNFTFHLDSQQAETLRSMLEIFLLEMTTKCEDDRSKVIFLYDWDPMLVSITELTTEFKRWKKVAKQKWKLKKYISTEFARTYKFQLMKAQTII